MHYLQLVWQAEWFDRMTFVLITTAFWQAFCREKITRERLMKMDSNGTGDVSRAEFMEYMLLEVPLMATGGGAPLPPLPHTSHRAVRRECQIRSP